MASANYEKAQELWHSFYQDVMYHQRYFISHPILQYLVNNTFNRLKINELH